MAEFKVVISDKGKSVQKEVKDPEASLFIGKKVGETINGDALALEGYEFEITGGSDYCGFPMRNDVQGIKRKKILTTGGTGVKAVKKGTRIRKAVAGNTIYEQTAQINLKVIKAGAQPLFEEKKEEAKEAAQ